MCRAVSVVMVCLSIIANQCSAIDQEKVTFSCSRPHERHACLWRQETCENAHAAEDAGARDAPCVHACYCEPGRARDHTGACVLLRDCPKDPRPSPLFVDPPIGVEYTHGHVHVHW